MTYHVSMNNTAILHFALRSIIRQKSRNAFIIVIVCLTSIFSLFTASLFEGKNHQLKNSIIETETGHWQVLDKGYFDTQDPLNPEVLDRKLLKKLKPYKMTPELLLKTTILHPEGSQELTLIGIEPESHENVFPLKAHVTGTWPIPKENRRTVVIGQKFAEKLKLAIGDDLVITYQDKNNAILNEALTVIGIFNKYGAGFEGHNAYVRNEVIQDLLSLADAGSFHRVILKPQDAKVPPVIKNKNLVLKSWNNLYPELSIMMKFHDGTTRTLIIFMLVIAFISIITPINILWDERKDEVKLLRTLGTGDKTIYLLGACEAITIITISLLLSVTIWGILHFLSIRNGLDFTLLGEQQVVREGIQISPLVYPVINWLTVITILIFHAAIIFGSNYFCVKKLVKKEVIDA